MSESTDSPAAVSSTDTSDNNSVSQPTERQTRLVDIPISSENVALNVLIGFLSVAQKRGTFLFDESAKINECIKVFMKPAATGGTSD